MRILVVEDEEAMASGLKFNFEQEGYDVVVASDGQQAVDTFKDAREDVDLIVLDLMLPSMSGYEVCRAIREIDNHVPIVVLSARTLSEDRALAFDCGTDQYLSKPFHLPELLTRVRTLIERRQAMAASKKPKTRRGDVCEFGNVRVDFRTYLVHAGDKTYQLTTTEAKLLAYFLDNEGRVLARSEILDAVWGDDRQEITTRTIDNFVLRLRKFIEPNPAEPRHILSVRGTGYRFVSTPIDVNNGGRAT
jgi:two-component system OmpR family response regulator